MIYDTDGEHRGGRFSARKLVPRFWARQCTRLLFSRGFLGTSVEMLRNLSGGGDAFFFFFQAEDGIRDLTVTGVQTCALPISLQKLGDLRAQRIAREEDDPPKKMRVIPSQGLVETRPVELRHLEVAQDEVVRSEIGRASCRERV